MNYLSDEQKIALRSWHETINDIKGRRLRASLRQCEDINQVCQTEGFRSLLFKKEMSSLLNNEQESWRFIAMALIAATVSHVKVNNELQFFATQLGVEKNGRPLMSELRFSRLCHAKSHDDLLRQLRRAVKLCEGEINIPALAEGIFRWCREESDYYLKLKPTEYIRIRWAMEYYQAVTPEDDQLEFDQTAHPVN
ncbi:type I-E CRISPR-associated protein Cse2/CasB [Chimaeribacter californicus]|uniref:type I-E CRISPR-associated protein Cse2/CasB n=1 Tax=Chimaeribacter californicus TaxID=2060067 RepID=UPI0013FD0C08